MDRQKNPKFPKRIHDSFIFFVLPDENSPSGWRGSDCQKNLAEFAAKAANKAQIVFGHGVYVDENSSQAASVEFVCRRQINYARSRLQKTGEKA